MVVDSLESRVHVDLLSIQCSTVLEYGFFFKKYQLQLRNSCKLKMRARACTSVHQVGYREDRNLYLGVKIRTGGSLHIKMISTENEKLDREKSRLVQIFLKKYRRSFFPVFFIMLVLFRKKLCHVWYP